jgi:hypothetical protein
MSSSMSSSMPSFMHSVKFFNNTQLKNFKKKPELNPSALEFIPENIKKDDFKQYDNKKTNEIFDSLEKDFIKNNDWIFYV